MAGNKKTNRLTRVLFIIYLVAICWILLFKLGVRFSYMENRSVNLIPFSDALDAGQIIMNVVIFIPLGIYAGVLFKRWSPGKKVLFFFFSSLVLEGFQYIFRIGAFDSTDIITNTSGAIIGLLLYEAIETIANNSVKVHQFINIVAAIGTIIMISLLWMLKMNLLPVRYQ